MTSSVQFSLSGWPDPDNEEGNEGNSSPSDSGSEFVHYNPTDSDGNAINRQSACSSCESLRDNLKRMTAGMIGASAKIAKYDELEQKFENSSKNLADYAILMEEKNCSILQLEAEVALLRSETATLRQRNNDCETELSVVRKQARHVDGVNEKMRVMKEKNESLAKVTEALLNRHRTTQENMTKLMDAHLKVKETLKQQQLKYSEVSNEKRGSGARLRKLEKHNSILLKILQEIEATEPNLPGDIADKLHLICSGKSSSSVGNGSDDDDADELERLLDNQTVLSNRTPTYRSHVRSGRGQRGKRTGRTGSQNVFLPSCSQTPPFDPEAHDRAIMSQVQAKIGRSSVVNSEDEPKNPASRTIHGRKGISVRAQQEALEKKMTISERARLLRESRTVENKADPSSFVAPKSRRITRSQSKRESRPPNVPKMTLDEKMSLLETPSAIATTSVLEAKPSTSKSNLSLNSESDECDTSTSLRRSPRKRATSTNLVIQPEFVKPNNELIVTGEAPQYTSGSSDDESKEPSSRRSARKRLDSTIQQMELSPSPSPQKCFSQKGSKKYRSLSESSVEIETDMRMPSTSSMPQIETSRKKGTRAQRKEPATSALKPSEFKSHAQYSQGSVRNRLGLSLSRSPSPPANQAHHNIPETISGTITRTDAESSKPKNKQEVPASKTILGRKVPTVRELQQAQLKKMSVKERVALLKERDVQSERNKQKVPPKPGVDVKHLPSAEDSTGEQIDVSKISCIVEQDPSVFIKEDYGDASSSFDEHPLQPSLLVKVASPVQRKLTVREKVELRKKMQSQRSLPDLESSQLKGTDVYPVTAPTLESSTAKGSSSTDSLDGSAEKVVSLPRGEDTEVSSALSSRHDIANDLLLSDSDADHDEEPIPDNSRSKTSEREEDHLITAECHSPQSQSSATVSSRHEAPISLDEPEVELFSGSLGSIKESVQNFDLEAPTCEENNEALNNVVEPGNKAEIECRESPKISSNLAVAEESLAAVEVETTLTNPQAQFPFSKARTEPTKSSECGEFERGTNLTEVPEEKPSCQKFENADVTSKGSAQKVAGKTLKGDAKGTLPAPVSLVTEMDTSFLGSILEGAASSSNRASDALRRKGPRVVKGTPLEKIQEQERVETRETDKNTMPVRQIVSKKVPAKPKTTRISSADRVFVDRCPLKRVTEPRQRQLDKEKSSSTSLKNAVAVPPSTPRVVRHSMTTTSETAMTPIRRSPRKRQPTEEPKISSNLHPKQNSILTTEAISAAPAQPKLPSVEDVSPSTSTKDDASKEKIIKVIIGDSDSEEEMLIIDDPPTEQNDKNKLGENGSEDDELGNLVVNKDDDDEPHEILQPIGFKEVKENPKETSSAKRAILIDIRPEKTASTSTGIRRFAMQTGDLKAKQKMMNAISKRISQGTSVPRRSVAASPIKTRTKKSSTVPDHALVKTVREVEKPSAASYKNSSTKNSASQRVTKRKVQPEQLIFPITGTLAKRAKLSNSIEDGTVENRFEWAIKAFTPENVDEMLPPAVAAEILTLSSEAASTVLHKVITTLSTGDMWVQVVTMFKRNQIILLYNKQEENILSVAHSVVSDECNFWIPLLKKLASSIIRSASIDSNVCGRLVRMMGHCINFSKSCSDDDMREDVTNCVKSVITSIVLNHKGVICQTLVYLLLGHSYLILEYLAEPEYRIFQTLIAANLSDFDRKLLDWAWSQRFPTGPKLSLTEFNQAKIIDVVEELKITEEGECSIEQDVLDDKARKTSELLASLLTSHNEMAEQLRMQYIDSFAMKIAKLTIESGLKKNDTAGCIYSESKIGKKLTVQSANKYATSILFILPLVKKIYLDNDVRIKNMCFGILQQSIENLHYLKELFNSNPKPETDLLLRIVLKAISMFQMFSHSYII